MAKIVVNYKFGWFDSAFELVKSEFHQGSTDPTTGGVSIVCSFQNLTGKTIKYLNLGWEGYNRVGDCVAELEVRTFTGPLSNNSVMKDQVAHNIWYCSTVSSVKLYSAYIIYMDGTEETILTNSGFNSLKRSSVVLTDSQVLELAKKQGLSVDKEGLLLKESSAPLSGFSASTSPSSNSTAASQKGGCYVATAVYGSYDCPKVWLLRRYRDSFLSKSILGRAFIKLYYSISPTFVRLFGRKKLFSRLFKVILDKKTEKLLELGYSDKPYED